MDSSHKLMVTLMLKGDLPPKNWSGSKVSQSMIRKNQGCLPQRRGPLQICLPVDPGDHQKVEYARCTLGNHSWAVDDFL